MSLPYHETDRRTAWIDSSTSFPTITNTCNGCEYRISIDANMEPDNQKAILDSMFAQHIGRDHVEDIAAYDGLIARMSVWGGSVRHWSAFYDTRNYLSEAFHDHTQYCPQCGSPIDVA